MRSYRRVNPVRAVSERPGSLHVYSRGVRSHEEVSAVVIEKDPVCGMDVDPERRPDLRVEHDGTTYSFCGKGCMLEFQEDPERFLAPDHDPHM
jgi:Cu+-exporting ATPase